MGCLLKVTRVNECVGNKNQKSCTFGLRARSDQIFHKCFSKLLSLFFFCYVIEEVAYLRDISFVPCRASLVSFRSKIVCLCLMKLAFFFFLFCVSVCVCIHECVAIYRCVCVYTCICVSLCLKECTETLETYKKLGSICFLSYSSLL